MNPSFRRAFTLLEMVVVLALVAILLTMVFTSGAFSKEGVSLRATSEELVRLVSKAKQMATLTNRSQDLRWFRWDDDQRSRLALIRFSETADGEWKQADDPWILPEEFMLLEDETTLFSALPESHGQPEPPESIPTAADAVSWIVQPSGKSQFAEAAVRGNEEFRFALAPAFVSEDVILARQVVFFLDPATSNCRFVQP
ncbi:MAG: prepilin-type N-terminal cleavage/methylation domain-containing protein [Verrucomicrobiota bacterium]